ncbi:gamma carbonic anhydrase family protein [Breznakiella homolactica]|uniref:Gamma carbonic anhydrase family protein n=1 Tax=Breznakiella homolactica TaxID=2798577 RepID=A0A7T7XN63_9SPIR|nr:gamma carbonic anhydrase family protein [Breznakiella homolactica]QQO09401.1 gamma carbonic anhydrase family protein [Breznakiella homolactica]
MVHTIGDTIPIIGKNVFIAWNAEVAGNIILDEGCSVWFSAVLRGDFAPIKVGEGSNIQDGSVLHTDENIPCTVGKYVTIGHRVILHSCTVSDGCLIGMGSVLLGNAHIGEYSIVGAGSLVPRGKIFPPRSLIMGSPARRIRDVTDEEIADLKRNAEIYVKTAAEAAKNYRKLETE